MADDIVEIFVDGACRGNPGPGGWGAVLRCQGTDQYLWGGAAQTTNNRMELQAAIAALESLSSPRTVAVTTDSEYVKKGITEWVHNWKKRGWKTADRKPVKNADLWQALDVVAARHQTSWHWVRGHSGHPENELADQLANRGVDELLAAAARQE